MPSELRVRCPDTIAQPLTTGDQYDTARALAQSVRSYRECKARNDALVDAVEVREQVIQSVKQQIESSK